MICIRGGGRIMVKRIMCRDFRIPIILIGAGVAIFVGCGDSGAVGSDLATATWEAIATSQPSASSTVDATPTSGIVISEDAEVKTEEQAVDRALATARELLAENPRVVSVELTTLETAFVRTQRDPAATEAVDLERDGYDEELKLSPVWRVQLDGAEFAAESCPPPDEDSGEPGEGSTCPTYPTAIFIIAASDGVVINMSLGYPVPQ
jgi:hypothetical protein